MMVASGAGDGGQTFHINIHTNQISDLTETVLENIFRKAGAIVRRKSGW
jgi:hypothetical protein